MFYLKDDVTGDGTTSTVLLIGEFLKQMDLAKIQDLNKKVARLGFVTQVTMLRSFAIVYTFNSTRM